VPVQAYAEVPAEPLKGKIVINTIDYGP